MSGFIALHREARDHPLFAGDAQRFGAWFWLVATACWKPTKFNAGGTIITLERGQLCVSRNQLATAWGMSPSAVERFLTRLQTEQMIGRSTGQARSIITICNYDTYQGQNDEAGQATGQATGQRPDKDRTTKEQGNKGTRLEEEPNGSSPPVCPPSKNRPTGSVAKRLSEDWSPILTPAAQRTVDGWPPGKFEHELSRFRDHAADKGRTSKDWQAAFRTWITKANEWMNQNGNGPRNRSAPRDTRDGFQRHLDEKLERFAAERASGASGRPDDGVAADFYGLPVQGTAAGTG